MIRTLITSILFVGLCVGPVSGKPVQISDTKAVTFTIHVPVSTQMHMRGFLSGSAALALLDEDPPAPAPEPKPDAPKGACTYCGGTGKTGDGLNVCAHCKGSGKEPVATTPEETKPEPVVEKPLPPPDLFEPVVRPFRPLIAVYSLESGCKYCNNFERDRPALNDTFRFLIIKDEMMYPAWIKDALNQGQGFPFFYWNHDGDRYRHAGWSGAADLKGRYDASVSLTTTNKAAKPEKKQNPQKKKEPVQYFSVHKGYPIRSSSSWWAGCDSWKHLTKGEHAGMFDADWLQTLSWDSVQSLHSDAHEGTIKWQYVVKPGSLAATKPYSSKSKPAPRKTQATGKCPNC